MNKPPFYSRFLMTGVAFSLVGFLIIAQMVHIQTSAQAKAVTDYGKEWAYVPKTISPERGRIYDREGQLLVGNTVKYEIGINLADVSDPETIARAMETILGMDYTETLEKAGTDKSNSAAYVLLKDFVETEKAQEIISLMNSYSRMAEENTDEDKYIPNLNGIILTPHLQRSYPEGSLASNVLGFYTLQTSQTSQTADRHEIRVGNGYFGVEEKFNDLLAGTSIDVQVPLDPNQVDQVPQVPPGGDIVLTIDREIQTAMEKVLDSHVKSSKSESGTLIVLDPKTGEVLAMANSPRLDPNEYWKISKVFSNAAFYNRAVSTTYEPGSVFKVLTMAAALDAGKVTPETPFLDTGEFEIGGAIVRNWDGNAWGEQNMIGCMQHSLNVCLSWIATQLGPKQFYDYMEKFGIGHKTGIDLAGEAEFPLRLPGDGNWYDVDLATNSFGQGLAVTPIQLASAISAIANDGKMMAPHVVKSIVSNGRQYNTTNQVISQPVTPETAHTLTDMLAVSLEEESSDALVEGYRVAGKTGTGEIPTPYGYSLGVTNASFVGWGPVDDPRFLVYVWLEKPKTSIWGSIVAAPVFRDAVYDLVVLMNIPPDEARAMLKN
jgi:cell division protein FtsI/penicillin-binding protein 2